MSCTLTHLIPRLAVLTGLSAAQIAMVVDAARRHAARGQPDGQALDLAPDVVDAILRQRPRHDRTAVTAALRSLLAALIQLRNQGVVDARHLDPLLSVLTTTPPAGIAPPIPVVAASIRSRLGVPAPDDPPPAPLPVVLPSDLASQQRAVRAAARFAPWTDEEAGQIADIPRLAGLAWALGVDHPLIRATVEQSLVAAVAAICAGATDPDLLARGTAGAAIYPNLAAADRDAWAAVQVIAAHRDLAVPKILDVVCYDRAARHAVVDACGPPRLWQRLTKGQRADILRRYRCTPAERAWIAALATHTPPAWTVADDQMAARFPWRDALRTAILGVTGARTCCEETGR